MARIISNEFKPFKSLQVNWLDMKALDSIRYNSIKNQNSLCKQREKKQII